MSERSVKADRGMLPKEPPPTHDVPRHRKRALKRKPWAVQIKSVPCGDGWVFFPDWTTVWRYATREQAEQAVRQREKGDRHFPGHEPRRLYRIVGTPPSGRETHEG